jgi:hypothetical protein
MHGFRNLLIDRHSQEFANLSCLSSTQLIVGLKLPDCFSRRKRVHPASECIHENQNVPHKSLLQIGFVSVFH